jgi:L-amino acid N-acyltransferase YncA
MRDSDPSPRRAAKTPPPGSPSLVVRRARLADAARIAEVYNEAILTTTATFDIEPKTVADREAWLETHGERFPVLVGELDGTPVGFASLTPWSDRAAYDDTAEVGLYVHSSRHGQGIGKTLYAAIIEEARRLEFHSLIARVTQDSAASIHLNKAAGFVVVGTLEEVGRKFDRLLDVVIMQKMLN